MFEIWILEAKIRADQESDGILEISDPKTHYFNISFDFSRQVNIAPSEMWNFNIGHPNRDWTWENLIRYSKSVTRRTPIWTHGSIFKVISTLSISILKVRFCGPNRCFPKNLMERSKSAIQKTCFDGLIDTFLLKIRKLIVCPALPFMEAKHFSLEITGPHSFEILIRPTLM